jgi:hypothetical protein
MDRFFFRLVFAYYWLRVAASPFLMGALAGAGVYYFVRNPAGIVIWAMLGVVGLFFGIKLANRAHREGRLVQLAEAIPPGGIRPREE